MARVKAVMFERLSLRLSHSSDASQWLKLLRTPVLSVAICRVVKKHGQKNILKAQDIYPADA